jgi:hypothetical protein
MRLIAALVITLFLSATVIFVVVGLGAQQQARVEHAGMLRRLDATREARATIPTVSYAQTEALAAERGRLAELGNQRLAMLTDQRYAPAARSLESVLERSRLPSLQPGAPVRLLVDEWAAEDPRTEASLAGLFSLVHLAGIQEVEGLARREQDALGIPDLDSESFELVVVSEMEDVLEFLESLVPGRGEPVLSLTGASLRRIEQSLWSTTPAGLETPPVRLWVRLEAHHVVAPDTDP